MESKRMRKNKFEELPKKQQHALELLVEWNGVIVYEIDKKVFGFYVLDKHLPWKSEFIESVQDILRNRFSNTRYAYFPKGGLYLKGSQIEIIEFCSLSQGYGFSIELHSNDYGFLYGERAKWAPAHLHVLDENKEEIGLLAIAGPCPKKISDIKEYKPPFIFDDKGKKMKTPLMSYRKNLVEWANKKGCLYSRWEWAQETWFSIHGEKKH
jgi:hypothetical protein